MHHYYSPGNYGSDDEPWDDDDSFYEDSCGDDDPYNCFMDDDTIEMKAGSSMDCTGLIPALPESDDALEAYDEMYRYPGGISRLKP